MVSVAVGEAAGGTATLTDAGLMLQLPLPKALTQLRLTVPAKPSCEEMVIEPVVPVLPAFTLGKAVGSLSAKVGLRITSAVNVIARGTGAPLVLACTVTV